VDNSLTHFLRNELLEDSITPETMANQANYSLLALEGQFIERERYLNLLRNECDMPNPHSLQPSRPEARPNGNPSTSSYPLERVEDIILALERLLIFNRHPSGNKPISRPIATKKSLEQPKRKSLPYVVKSARQRRINSCAFLKDDYIEQFRKQALQKSKKFKIFVAQALFEAKRTEDERRAFEQEMRKNKLKNCGLIPESIITTEDESENKEGFALLTNKTLNRPETILISEDESEENKDFAQLTKHIVISDDEAAEEVTAIESFIISEDESEVEEVTASESIIISEDESDENENEEFAQPTQEPVNRPRLITISEDELDEKEEFPQLTKEHLSRLMELKEGHPEEFVVSKFKLDVYLSDIKILIGGRWLNDVVINFYMNLLIDRSEKRSGQLPSVYSMNTFFMPRLLQSGFEGVKRWTRKVDILSKDIILIPVTTPGGTTVTPRHVRSTPLGKIFPGAKLNTTSISIRAPSIPQLNTSVTASPTAVSVSGGATVAPGRGPGAGGTALTATNLPTTRIIQLQQPATGTAQQIIGSGARLAGNVMLQPFLMSTTAAAKMGKLYTQCGDGGKKGASSKGS